MKEVKAYFTDPLAEVAAVEASPEGFVEADGHFVFYRENPDEVIASLKASHRFTKIEVTEFSDSGWQTNYLKYQKPVQLCPDIWTGKDIFISSTNGFGTGSHATTRLCAEQIYQLKPQSMLDVGCGSGILSILAKKLGVKTVVGVDIDKDAVEASRTNARENQVDAEFSATPIEKVDGEFELVVANILSETLLALWPDIVRLSAKTIVLSGILTDEEEAFVKKLGINNYTTTRLEEWLAIKYFR